LRIMSLYAVISLSVTVVAIFLTDDKSELQINQTITTETVETEYVYVKSDRTYPSDTAESTEQSETYTVREYNEKIGVFSSDGILVRTVDVYVKTLPEADRRMLREGIEITGEKQLNSLIEDYDG